MLRLRTTAPSPDTDPKADIQLGCLTDPLGFPNDSAGRRLRSIPEGIDRLGPT